MSEIASTTATERPEIRESLIDSLFEALRDPDPAVRTGALRLLVRLPLPDHSWYRMGDLMYDQIELSLHPQEGKSLDYPFEELLEAALRIPLGGLRNNLYQFLDPGIPEGVRQQVAWALVRARDRNAVSFLETILEDKRASNRQEAAFWLAHYEHLYPLDEFIKLALKDQDPVVRFWLSIAMAGQDEIQPFVQLITHFLEGKIELPVLYGNPFALKAHIKECGPFPDSVLYLLQGDQTGERQSGADKTRGLDKLRKLADKKPEKFRELGPVFEALHEALTDRATQEPGAVEYPAPPTTPWEGNLDEVVESLVQSGGYTIDDLPQLSLSQRTTLVSAWFAALEKLTAADEQTGEVRFFAGIGNPIVQLPGWFWQGFDPDLAQLFDIYLCFYPEHYELAEQLAWVVSRAGVPRLTDEYLPVLPVLEAQDKTVLLKLLERAVFYASKDFGSIYGAGPSAGDDTPPTPRFIDLKSAAGGDDESPGTLTEGEAARYVQAEVFDNTDQENPQKLEQVFLAGKEQLLKVWIGELQAGAIAAPAPVDLGLLPDLPSWDLEVYFWEPKHAPGVQVGKLTVYQEPLPDLPVSTCEFTFTPRADLPNFQGRLAVVYKKNVLQMLFLEGKVLADPAAAGENDQIRLQWAEVKGLSNADQLQPFDLVFYNEADATLGDGLMFFGGQAGLKQVSGLQQGIKDIIANLREAGAPGGVVSLEAKKESLIILANLGSMLYSTILEQIGADNEALVHLENAQRLQLVSAVRDVFPLELIYVKTPPNPDAELCSNAQQALQIGACFTCEGLDEESAAKVICPLGFLGVRCTIERHAIQPLQKSDTLLEGKDYLVRIGLSAGGKTIAPLKSSLGSTSGKVDAKNKKKFSANMQTLFAERFVFAENWAEWKNNIQEKTLLVLIPHTLKDRGLPSLEIGNTKLWQTAIKDAVAAGTKPIVLLIGCETAVPDVPYQGFAAAFAKAGAAIIVMTLSPIHESHAVPITEILVNQLRQSAQMQHPFSEALLQARRTAMAAGYAEALTLVADGDADWILVEEG
jgi:hypothetical protein